MLTCLPILVWGLVAISAVCIGLASSLLVWISGGLKHVAVQLWRCKWVVSARTWLWSARGAVGKWFRGLGTSVATWGKTQAGPCIKAAPGKAGTWVRGLFRKEQEADIELGVINPPVVNQQEPSQPGVRQRLADRLRNRGAN